MIDKDGKEIFESIDADKFVMDSYAELGAHIMGSGYQVGRAFVDILDGLKPAYRHGLQALLEAPNRFVKTSYIVGDMIRKYHFTGDMSIPDVLYSLVNDYKCVDPQGNTGSRTMTESISGSAQRYTELKLKDEIREQLNKLLPFVPDQVSATGFKEKRYIPTPVPLGMVAGTGTGRSMGVGMANLLPAFTAKSMLNAYHNADCNRLKFNYGYTLGEGWDDKKWYDNVNNIVISENRRKGTWEQDDPVWLKDEPSDYNKQGLKNLWETGYGSLEYRIPMYYCEIEGRTGIMCVCDPKYCAVYKSDTIIDWEANGYVEVFEFTDTVSKMFFSITDGTRKVKLDDLLNEVYYNCGASGRMTFSLNVSVGNITGPIRLSQWIEFTYKNYVRLYQKYIETQLEKLEFDKTLWLNFKRVASLIIDGKLSYEEIVKEVNKKNTHPITYDHAYTIGTKPINSLRTTDPQKKLDSIKEQLDYYNSLNINVEIFNFVDCWDNLVVNKED